MLRQGKVVFWTISIKTFKLLILLLVVLILLSSPLGADAPVASVFLNIKTKKLPFYCVDSTSKQISISFDASWGADKTESIVIDGKGEHTITFNNTNSDWNAIYTKNENAVLTIKNATIDNSGHNADSGPWNSHDIIFNCNVVLDNVKSNNAIAVGKNATIKNSTITDSTCEQAAYMLWIQANGQTVTIENCKIEGKSTITNDNRAIKIADEYINEPKAVTLNVSDTTFSSDSKAAVLVTNTAGATINWGEENDISETVDTVNAVWIDSDRADYMDRVVVNGCKKVQE